jgi:hypothetical protein
MLMKVGAGLLFMVFNATSTKFQLHVYHGCQFYWWRKLEYQEKTTHLLQVNDKIDKGRAVAHKCNFEKEPSHPRLVYFGSVDSSEKI